MALKVKSRIFKPTFSKRGWKNLLIDTKTGATTVTSGSWSDNLDGFQVTESEGHPWHLKPRPAGDIGGPFFTRKLFVEDWTHNGFDVSYLISGGLGRRVLGNAYAHPSSKVAIPKTRQALLSSTLYPNPSSSDELLESLGTVAVSRCNPVNPGVDLVTSLSELYKDGIPTILGLKTLKDRNLKGLADDYLNWSFGWSPIISDLKDLGETMKKQDKILKQLRRDSGRLVRRSYHFPTERSTETRNLGTTGIITSTPTDAWNGTSGTLTCDVETTRKRWFSGAFTYYLPPADQLDGFSRMATEADRLYGVVPGVDDVWNLIPWSWAVDWFVNVGPVLQNVSNFAKYGLVMPYGYMMENTIVKYRYTLSGVSLKTGPSGPLRVTVVDETKKRVRASPFGFGLTWEEFDSYQVSILAALGISKAL